MNPALYHWHKGKELSLEERLLRYDMEVEFENKIKDSLSLRGLSEHTVKPFGVAQVITKLDGKGREYKVTKPRYFPNRWSPEIVLDITL